MENLFTSDILVSFTTTLPFADILTFYQEEMIANGWSQLDDETIISGNSALLNFQMVGQKAVVTISETQDGPRTVVQIILQAE